MMLRNAIRIVVALFIMVLLMPAFSDTARAQRSQVDPLAEASGIDGEESPFLYDPFGQIWNYFQQRLPTAWFISLPEFNAGTHKVNVHIPYEWRGSPASAMLNLCPPVESELWKHIDWIQLTPVYRRQSGPPILCRKTG